MQLTRFTTVRALVTSFLFFINSFNYFGNANIVHVSVIAVMKYFSLNKIHLYEFYHFKASKATANSIARQ